MRYLITGGCGFLGSNISAEILGSGEDLYVFDNLSRLGSVQNLQWLKKQGDLNFIHGDIRNFNDIERVVESSKPDVVFHLAGQVAMTTSIANPKLDFEVNTCGTLNLLESVRKHVPETIVVYSSTNKVYGDLEWVQHTELETRYIAEDFPNGFNEETLLEFHSPYGCSKGAADQYMLDYARIFNLRTIVFRHSSMYGSRQFATYDQGWVGWFVGRAIETLKNPNTQFTISGDGKQVRDLLFAKDLVGCYLMAVEAIDRCQGQVFNIGGGSYNSLSVLELLQFLGEELNVSLRYKNIPWRESDQKVFIADISRAKASFGWQPGVGYAEGLREMVKWSMSNAD